MSVVYLDDWLCFGSSRVECDKNVQTTRLLLEELGFIINKDKSCLVPKTSCQFLGFILDSRTMSLGLPREKIHRILQLVERFESNPHCRVREFAQFLGTLTAACPAIPYGWVYTKALERVKYLNLLDNDSNYDADMTLSSTIRPDLHWWKFHIRDVVNPIRRQNYALEIFSDASLTGWGAACNGELTHGSWNAQEREYHINYLELLAAFFALRCFAHDKKECEILMRIDNTTAISYINRMGGVQFLRLNGIAQEIWQWCEERKLWIFASYIAPQENVEADRGSRIVNVDTE